MLRVPIKILRYNPENGGAPHWETFTAQAEPTDRILDALIYIKEHIDGTLTFRRSCAHGVCGSDAMMINGKNRLACQVLVRSFPASGDNVNPIEIAPLKGFAILKDLVVDMDAFIGKFTNVKPYLIAPALPVGSTERLQSPEELARYEDTTKCILCAACTTSCSTHWVNPEYIGPQAIISAHRFLLDSRDQGAPERLELMGAGEGVFRCRTVTNCADACPRGINIVKAIAEVRALLVKNIL